MASEKPLQNVTEAVENMDVVTSWLKYEENEAFSRHIQDLLRGNPMPENTEWEINTIGEIAVDIIYVPTYGYMAQSHGIPYEGAQVITENCKAFLTEATAGGEVRRIVTLKDPHSGDRVYGRYLLT